MTKREIIAKYEKMTGRKANEVLGDVYIYEYNNGSFVLKNHPCYIKKEIYSIGVYAIAFFNGMVEVTKIDDKGKEHDIYYGKCDN